MDKYDISVETLEIYFSSRFGFQRTYNIQLIKSGVNFCEFMHSFAIQELAVLVNNGPSSQPLTDRQSVRYVVSRHLHSVFGMKISSRSGSTSQSISLSLYLSVCLSACLYSVI